MQFAFSNTLFIFILLLFNLYPTILVSVMINADYGSKERIVSILAEAFENNKSVNQVVKNDHKRHKRIRILMEYAFDTAFSTGAVFLSEDRNGCALLLFPDKKNISLKGLLWNIKIALTCIGLSNIKPTLQRNALIKRSHPSSPIAHLWFLGVADQVQHTGIGTALLKDIIQRFYSKMCLN